MGKLIMVLFFSCFFFSQETNAKLIYKCEKVWIGGRQHLDVNVVFMTGYEILENITENKESYVKTNKYAMILLDEEMIIVVLDDPIEDNSENRNQGSNVEMGDIKNSNYSFANEYRASPSIGSKKPFILFMSTGRLSVIILKSFTLHHTYLI